MPSRTSPRIAIIGAGPAGLTLAALLQHKLGTANFTIFDLEDGPTYRDQGGTLDLHPKTGQLALREAGLLDAFIKQIRPAGDATRIINPNGEVLWDENDVPLETGPEEDESENNQISLLDKRPEIDRSALRNILLATIPPRVFQWNRKLHHIEPTGNNTHTLHFTDNSTSGPFDLVVGADGAWSKVRATITSDKPQYSGISAIELWALDVEQTNPWLAAQVGQGSSFMFDAGRSIVSQRNGAGGVRTYASLEVPEDWLKTCGVDWTDLKTAPGVLVDRYFADCGEELKRVILESDANITARALYMLPVGSRYESRQGLTLIGDSAHLMTPFSGSGVNLAMADSLSLADAIVEASTSGTSLHEAVQQYEAIMFPRAKVAQEKCFKQMQGCFMPGGSERMFEFLKSVRPEIVKFAAKRH